MKTKKFYEKPELEAIEFTTQDTVADSTYVPEEKYNLLTNSCVDGKGESETGAVLSELTNIGDSNSFSIKTQGCKFPWPAGWKTGDQVIITYHHNDENGNKWFKLEK